MRTGANLFHSPPLAKMTKAVAAATSKATSTPPTSLHSTSWHSPVPYLFGGLAAMLGLIAFALLILACSYWKISSEHVEDAEGGSSDEKGDSGSDAKTPKVLEEKVLVIMAGEVKPTFLATPRTCCSDDPKAAENEQENGDESNDR